MTSSELGEEPTASPAWSLPRPWPLQGNRRTIGYMASELSRSEVDAFEEAGTHGLWVGGHIISPNPTPEAMVGLAQLAAVTTTMTVGSAILLLPLYPAAIVAKQVADIDRLSDGRVILGVGVGGEYPTEFTACQVPIAERGGRFDESIGLLRALWRGEAVTNTGPYYPMERASIHPLPHQPGGPPILVAGRRNRAMRRAATIGDGWIPYMYSPDRYQNSVRSIRDHAALIGRPLDNFGWAVWTFINVNADGNQARRESSEFLMGIGHIQDDAIVDRVTVSGTETEVERRLREFIDAGVQHFIFSSVHPDTNTEALLRVQHEIAPALIGSEPHWAASRTDGRQK